MALSPEDVKALCAPFPFEDHEFTRGFAYITEQAITRRLDQVDPNWQFVILETVRDTTSASVTGRLIIADVSRDGVGTQTVEYMTAEDKSTGEKKVSLDLAGNPREAGEVRKGAATDALKRAARLFGVGRYILDAPKLRMASSSWTESRLDPASEKAFRAHLDRCSALSIEDATTLESEANRKGVSREDLLGRVLGVARYGEFEGNLDTARQRLREFTSQQQRASGR